jgi:RNA-directed DNA polymerase
MNKPTEIRPVAVPEGARRAGETLNRWYWVEPRVWTERMLTALEQGVKGGQWFSLIDKVIPQRALEAAFGKVAANRGAAGVDHVTIAMFETHLDDELRRLSEDLRDGTYRPQAIRRHDIPKPGSQEMRPLGIPICRSYCTSSQRSWGLSGEIQAHPWALPWSCVRPPRPRATGRLA